MTDERFSLGEIFDSILNNDAMWDLVTFKRSGKKVEISAQDTVGTKYHYSEEFQ